MRTETDWKRMRHLPGDDPRNVFGHKLEQRHLTQWPLMAASAILQDGEYRAIRVFECLHLMLRLFQSNIFDSILGTPQIGSKKWKFRYHT